MPSIKGPAYGGKTKGQKPHAFLWCTKLKEGQSFGEKTVSGLNCVIEVANAKKCMWNGKEANCVQTAHIYDIPKNAPKWRGFKKERKK